MIEEIQGKQGICGFCCGQAFCPIFPAVKRDVAEQIPTDCYVVLLLITIYFYIVIIVIVVI